MFKFGFSKLFDAQRSVNLCCGMACRIPSSNPETRVRFTFMKMYYSSPVMPKVSAGGGGWNFLFPLSVSYKALYPSLRLCSEVHSIAVLVCWCVSFDNRHRIACLLPSLTTEHYFVLILHVTATTESTEDGRLVLCEYTLTTSLSPKRRLCSSLF